MFLCGRPFTQIFYLYFHSCIAGFSKLYSASLLFRGKLRSQSKIYSEDLFLEITMILRRKRETRVRFKVKNLFLGITTFLGRNTAKYTVFGKDSINWRRLFQV